MKLINICFLALFLLFVGCGKNDSIRPAGNVLPPGYYPPQQGPINQAPLPPGGGYYPPPPGGPQQPPYFNPQMPPGMPPQYYPWLPMDNYFRQTPQLTQVWVNVWINWQSYAQNRGYDVYNFPAFWREYCPQNWQSQQYVQLYQYFDQSCYSWVDYNTQFAPQVDPSYFWMNYNGMPYSGMDYSCGDCWSY